LFYRVITILTLIGCTVSPSAAQEAAEKAQTVSLCQLLQSPAAYNKKLVEVRGVVSHGFESFSLSTPQCGTPLGIWLEYGGLIGSGTRYCYGATYARTRQAPLVVEDIVVPLVQDATFQRLDNYIQQRKSVTLRATLIGRFFSGTLQQLPAGEFWGGYGHFGCCSLLVIQQVRTVKPTNSIQHK